MAYEIIKGKSLKWYHFPKLEEADFRYIQKNFDFHALDLDDLRDSIDLPKVDVYKNYIFAIFHLPHIDDERSVITKKDLAVFIGKDFVITAARTNLEVVDRLFARGKRSATWREETMTKSSGYFLYKLLDYIFRDSRVALQELDHETHKMENILLNFRDEKSLRRLGKLKNNLVFFNHIIDPQRLLISNLVKLEKPFIPNNLDIYFDDIKDTLDGMWTVCYNLEKIVDSLFSVNAALLTYRTNKIIRILTVLSLLLMPPTLVASYYGMNVKNLPLAHDIVAVSFICLASLIIFVFVILYLDRRK